jgi:Ran GTPase-activating protein (RanGAP) involved in mRNA processing and transport
MLNENRSLSELRLGWNRLFHKGAAELALGMRSSLNLTRLDVQSNGLGIASPPETLVTRTEFATGI